jgi:hypothetical protein
MGSQGNERAFEEMQAFVSKARRALGSRAKQRRRLPETKSRNLQINSGPCNHHKSLAGYQRKDQ